MTNKETIYRQDVLDLAKKGILVSNGNYESVCKAINELPSVNPQPCEDAIDRAEAIKIASGYCHPANVTKELAKLPPVKPQKPKTGHWEWVQYDYNPKFGNWHCSECRCVVVECVGKEEKGSIPLYKYCPQCGAKMVEPQERSDKE